MAHCTPTSALLLSAIVLAGCAATPAAPRYDCGERLEQGGGVFESTGSYSHWSTFISSGPRAGIGAYIGYRDDRDPGRPPDLFTPRAFAFAPPLSVTETSVWLDLRVGDSSLPPIHLRRTRTSRGVASVPAPTLEPLLTGGGDLVITFFDDGGRLLDRVSIPTDRLRDAARQLGEMHLRSLERSRNPAERCEIMEDEIIVT